MPNFNFPPATQDESDQSEVSREFNDIAFNDIIDANYGENTDTTDKGTVEQQDTRPGMAERLTGRMKWLGDTALKMAMNGKFGEQTQGYAVKVDKARDAWANRDEYKQRAIDSVKSGVVETSKAGLGAAVDYVLNYYGIEKRMDAKTGHEKYRLEKEAKLGRRAVSTFAAPEAVFAKLLKGSIDAGKDALANEARSQFDAARNGL